MIKEYWNQIAQNRDVEAEFKPSEAGSKRQREAESPVFTCERTGGTISRAALVGRCKDTEKCCALMGILEIRSFGAGFTRHTAERSGVLSKAPTCPPSAVLITALIWKNWKERSVWLGKMEETQENRKHLMEEMRELSALVVRAEGIKNHEFTGFDRPYDIVLLTNRNFAGLTQEELTALNPDAKSKVFGAGSQSQGDEFKMDG